MLLPIAQATCILEKHKCLGLCASYALFLTDEIIVYCNALRKSMVQIIGAASLRGGGRQREKKRKNLDKRTVAATQANLSKVRGKAKPFHPTSCAPALQTNLACVADAPCRVLACAT